VKLKITYKELSIILGILVAVLAIFSYWLTIHQETPSDTTLQLKPLFDFEIGRISKFIHTTLLAAYRFF
jgi:hypothetical protein